MVKALIKFLPFVVSTATAAGCRREQAQLSATDSQATTVTTSSVVDSQPSVLPPAATSASAGLPSPEDTSPLHFSSPKDSLCGDLAENGFKADGVRTVVAAQFGRPDSVRVQAQTAIAATSSNLDSHATIVAATSTPAVSPTPLASGDTAPSVHFSSPKDSLCGEMAENGLLIPNTRRSAVAAQLGRPDSVRPQPAPNPHNPAQTDTVVDVFYRGLRLHYWVVAAAQAERDIILEIDVSDNRYLKYPSLGIGASADALVNAFGERAERTEDGYRYSCALHVMSGADMDFHFAGDRVKLIAYRYYAD